MKRTDYFYREIWRANSRKTVALESLLFMLQIVYPNAGRATSSMHPLVSSCRLVAPACMMQKLGTCVTSAPYPPIAERLKRCQSLSGPRQQTATGVRPVDVRCMCRTLVCKTQIPSPSASHPTHFLPGTSLVFGLPLLCPELILVVWLLAKTHWKLSSLPFASI